MAEKPKRPLSAYMLWLNSARDQIKRENPGIKVTEVAKKGGEIWRSMKDKTEWENKAAKAKEDYEEAVRKFEANGGSASNGAGKKRAKAGKKAAKKSKKAASDDDDDEEDSELASEVAATPKSQQQQHDEACEEEHQQSQNHRIQQPQQQYSPEQRIAIVKAYYKNSRSRKRTYEALRQAHNDSTQSSLGPPPSGTL